MALRPNPAATDSCEKQELDLVVGAIAKAASFDEATLELQIEFDNEVAVRADPGDKPPEHPAYTIRIRNQYWAVFADGRIDGPHA